MAGRACCCLGRCWAKAGVEQMSKNVAMVTSFFIPASGNVLALGNVYCYRVNTCHKRREPGGTSVHRFFADSMMRPAVGKI